MAQHIKHAVEAKPDDRRICTATDSVPRSGGQGLRVSNVENDYWTKSHTNASATPRIDEFVHFDREKPRDR